MTDVNTVEITLTPELLALANTYAEKVGKTRTMERPNYTSLSMKDRYYYGYVGELAVVDWFDKAGIRFNYFPRTDGSSDSGDFAVSSRGVTLRLDVKTASKHHYQRCMIPGAQFLHRRYDLYVAVRLSEDRPIAQVMGWARFRDVLGWEVDTFVVDGVATKSCLFSDLEIPKDLLEMLDRR